MPLRIFHNVPQNSDEWYALRLGRYTASNFTKLFMGKKTAGYRDTVYAVAAERLTGKVPSDRYYGGYMERGHALEPFAREAYEIDTFNEITNGGFWTLGDHIGASPDGLIGKDGIYEGKAPKYTTAIDYILKGELPSEYFWQVHGQMYVTDRSWCVFDPYHPDLPHKRLTVYRDEATEAALIKELSLAIEQAEEIFSKLQAIQEAA